MSAVASIVILILIILFVLLPSIGCIVGGAICLREDVQCDISDAGCGALIGVGSATLVLSTLGSIGTCIFAGKFGNMIKF